MPKGKRKPRAGLRPPSVRPVVVIDEIGGDPRVRAWPRPRGANRHPTNIFWTEWLRGVTFLWRYQPSKFVAQLTAATKGTPWMARDPFISGARGRAWSITDQEGRTYYPMPVREAVSQSLDTIAQLAGSMLARAATGWAEVPGGSPGEVLTSNGPAAIPSWQPGGVAVDQGASLQFNGSIVQASSGSNLIPWDTVLFDDAAFWSAASPTLITIPPGGGGRYLVIAQVTWASTTTVHFRTLIEDVATGAVLCGTSSPRGTSQDRVSNVAIALLDLVAGQQLQIRAERGPQAVNATINSVAKSDTRVSLTRL